MSNKITSVPFEVVEVWYNDYEAPYTLKPTRSDSKPAYAMKIKDEFYLIGESGDFGDSLYICDYEYPEDKRGG